MSTHKVGTAPQTESPRRLAPFRRGWRRAIVLAAGFGLVVADPAAAQTLTVLHHFTPIIAYQNSDGATPNGLVVVGNTLYGTTWYGGRSFGGYGTVFRVNPDGGAFTNLHNFLGSADGCFPQGVTLSGARLFGMTGYAGSSGVGTLFRYDLDTTAYSVAHAFDTNGGYPYGIRLVADAGILYGATTQGYESPSRGTVFKLNADGTGFTNFYTFTGGDGDTPGTLVLSGNTLYGATTKGGSTGAGTIFKINTDGTGFASLYDFTATHTNVSGVYTNSDGASPGFLVLAGDTLCGAAGGGGSNGSGTIFKIGTNGTGFALLHTFTAAYTNAVNVYTNSDGTGPVVWIASSNTLYGAAGSGPSGSGTVFRLNTDGTGFTNLHTFAAGAEDAAYFNHPYTNSDGIGPGALVLSGSTVYGVASRGGAAGSGTLFSLSLGPTVPFVAAPTNGTSPLTVQFTSPAGDSGGGALASWYWDFGDGSTGVDQNPVHTYAQPGIYSPVLVATNSAGDAVQGIGSWITVIAPSAQFSASPTNGLNPLAVQFNSATSDSSSRNLVSWNWDFGDGSASTNQNPQHTYTQAGRFFPTLVATNDVGSAVVGIGPPISAGTFLVNGGFETGDFSGWTLSGSGASVAMSSAYVHAGQYGAELSAYPDNLSLSQTVLTRPGASYRVSFWVHNLSGSFTGLQVAWAGTNVFVQPYAGDTGWTNVQLTVTALANSAGLTLRAYDYGGAFSTPDLGLDDVSIAETSATPRVVLDATGSSFIAGQLQFQVYGPASQQAVMQASTNLANWLPLSTNTFSGGSFGFTDNQSAGTSQRFYRALLLP